MGYLQHGRRHLPGGTDPIPGLAFPPWVQVDTSTITLNDGSIDTDLSYLKLMVQGTDQFDSVFALMRIVLGAGSFVPQVTSLPGINFANFTDNTPIFTGLAWTSAVDTWDTPHHAYMLSNGKFVYPFDSPSFAEGDILFAGGGVYPYSADWPNP